MNVETVAKPGDTILVRVKIEGVNVEKERVLYRVTPMHRANSFNTVLVDKEDIIQWKEEDSEPRESI